MHDIFYEPPDDRTLIERMDDEMPRKEKKNLARFTKHGHSVGGKVSPEYASWQCLIQRCTNDKNDDYENYGGRGITVCERWSGENGFQNFLDDMGPRPARTSIDRIDNDGNYEPSNCRWATRIQQANNTRRTQRKKNV